ncbi:MAG: cupin domain-containing protein, partial [bacterium]|nr:cupin domain-containing protein [bacterium]
VVAGRARILIGDAERQVQPGSIIFVRASSEHRFVEIEEDLTLLVFFGGTGGSQ